MIDINLYSTKRYLLSNSSITRLEYDFFFITVEADIVQNRLEV